MKIPKNKYLWRKLEQGKVKFISYEFKFKDGILKKKKIKFNKNPIKLQGGSGGPCGIKIDKLFFKFKTNKEKNALLWHELYHCKLFVLKLNNRTSLRFQWAKIISWFDRDYVDKKIHNENNLLWIEESEADKYSALQNSFSDCLKYLNRIKKLYYKNPSFYNPTTHPPIGERIKRIEKLKETPY